MAAIPSDKDRLFLDLDGSFAAPVTAFAEDPRLVRGEDLSVREALMGDIIRPGSVPMRLAVEVVGTAPIERLDVLHSLNVVQNGASLYGRRSRPPRARHLVRRGVPRPRDRVAGKTEARGQPLYAFCAGEFPQPGTEGAGNRARHRAGLDFGDDRKSRRHRHLARRGAARSRLTPTSSPVRSISRRLSSTAAASAAGSASIACLSRIWSRRLAVDHVATFPGGAGLSVYVRVTQSDGHQAWSSPIYLID